MSELSDAELAAFLDSYGEAHEKAPAGSGRAPGKLFREAARRLRQPTPRLRQAGPSGAKEDEQLARSFAKGWYPDDDEWTRCKALTEDFLAYEARVRRETIERGIAVIKERRDAFERIRAPGWYEVVHESDQCIAALRAIAEADALEAALTPPVRQSLGDGGPSEEPRGMTASARERAARAICALLCYVQRKLAKTPEGD